MRPRKIFEQEPQFAQAFGRHEVSVVDDWHKHFPCAVHAEGFLREQSFAVMIVAIKLDLEGRAEDAQGVVISMERAVDDGRDDAFLILIHEGLLEDGFAGAGFAEDQTEPALLGVDFQNVEDLLLVREQRERFRVEGDFLKAEVGADHGCASVGWFGLVLSGF